MYSGSDILLLFKVLGKFIYVYNHVSDTALEYNGIVMATVRQAVSGVAGEYPDFSKVIVPYQLGMDSIIQTINAGASIAQSAIENLLVQIASFNIGLDDSADVPTVIQALSTLMTSLSITCLDTADGGLFNTFFFNNYAVQVNPTSVEADAEILEAWVTGTLIGDGVISAGNILPRFAIT